MMQTQPNYCACCYSAASKAGRTTRKTDLYDYEVCALCEQRLREGLLHYRPSNGSEFDRFHDQCFDCRHYIDDLDDPQPGSLAPPHTCCSWGVLDRFMLSMVFDDDHISNWFDPADIEKGCPATCKRYTPNDYDFDDRDPPRPHDPNQLTFDDIDVPVERVTFPQRKAMEAPHAD